MDTFRTFCLLAVMAFGLALGAQPVTLSAKPLSEALQNPDLQLPEDDPKLAAARKAVSDLLLNQPTEAERGVFHQRLMLFARHKDTRLGRLFFYALAGCPDVGNVDAATQSVAVAATFPLALGSGARVRLGWTRKGDSFLVSEFAVEITGNAGALFSGAGPYFSGASVDPLILNADDLDYLLGRDPADRQKLESERGPFDFEAALKRRFELETGAPAALLEKLADELSPKKTPAEKVAALSPHLESDAARKELEQQGAKVDFWDVVQKQVGVLKTMPCPAAAPARPDAAISISRTTDVGTDEWALNRLANGKLGLRSGRIGAASEEGK